MAKQLGNPFHEPAGSPKGGQFTSGNGAVNAMIRKGAGIHSPRSGFKQSFEYEHVNNISQGTVHETNIVRGEDKKLYIEKEYETGVDTDKIMYTPQAEVSSAIVSEQLGIDNVPKTILLKDSRGDYYTLQEYIEGSVPSALRPIAAEDPESLSDIAILDYVTGNNDRHINNMLLDSDGNLWGIDNDAGQGLATFSTFDSFDSRLGNKYDFKDIFAERLKDYQKGWKNISEIEFKSWFSNIPGNEDKINSYWENFLELRSGEWEKWR